MVFYGIGTVLKYYRQIETFILGIIHTLWSLGLYTNSYMWDYI